MPRLINQDFIKIHQELRHALLHHQASYGRLSYRNQRLLHDFFKPAKPLTNDELLAHRQEVSTQRPALPAQAGKAYQLFVHGPAVAPTLHRGKRHTIAVRGIATPELDVEKLAQALIAIAPTRS